MKKVHVFLLLIVLIFTISCKNNKKEITKSTTTETEVITNDSNDVVSNEETTKETEIIEEKDDAIKTNQKEVSNTTVKKKIEKVAKTDNTSHNTTHKTVNKIEEVVSNTSNNVNKVIETTQSTANTTVQKVIEKPKKIVTKTVQEVVETPKPKPVPVVQELTLAQKIAKGKTLFNTGICKTCHDPKKKKIGPTLKEVGSKYKKKKASIVKFLQGKAKSIVWPDKFVMMKPNIDDVTSKMPKSDLEALEAYILSFGK